MVSLLQVKKDTFIKLVPVFGTRESHALTRALEEDLFDVSKKMFTDHELVIWNQAVHRLLLHEPVAYITGIAYFLDLKLKVNQKVLIPRPETETMVIEAIRLLKNIVHPKVLDIGTGSGCIALAIQAANSESTVYGLDIDESALKVARENAQLHKLKVQFVLSDFLDQKTWDDLPYDLDIIISNPPYILEREKKYMSPSTLNYEPSLALFAGDDPVRFYKAIATFGLIHLKKNGSILVEINEFLGPETRGVFEVEGYAKPELMKDLNGKDRIISVVKL